MKITPILEKLIEGLDLEKNEMRFLMQACMSGELTESQIAGFLVLMRAKGETAEELVTAAEVMLDLSHSIDLGDNLIDIVGTGGDGKNTFNISTISAFVTASTGLKVAKHGGNSVSGRSGSADFLLKAGFELLLTDEQLKSCLDKLNLCFLFAPHFHKAMLHAKKARQELGLRTFFNFLGPLINPAKPKRQVVGVFAEKWLKPLAEVLASLGSKHAMVINSVDGLDEVSISAPTKVIEYKEGQFNTWTINPKDYNCFHPTIDSLIVNSPEESLKIGLSVLQGELGPARDMILLNSGLAVFCAEKAKNLSEAIDIVRETIDSKKALTLFNQVQQYTQSFASQSHE